MHYALLLIADSFDEIEPMMAPYQENNCGNVPKEYLKFYEFEGDTWHDADTGKDGYWENPDAKWDWYELGGRYSNAMRTWGGNIVVGCKVGEIDAYSMFGKRGAFATFAVITQDGRWHECESICGDKEWEDSYRQSFLLDCPEKMAFLIDYHI